MNAPNIDAMWKKSGNAVDPPEKVARLIVNAIEHENKSYLLVSHKPFCLAKWHVPKCGEYRLKETNGACTCVLN